MKRFAFALGLVGLLVAAAWWWARPAARDDDAAAVNAPTLSKPGAEESLLVTPGLGAEREAAALNSQNAGSGTAAKADALARVFGTITHAKTGAAASAYELRAFGAGRAPARAVTDVEGRFEFRLAPGALFVGAAPRGAQAWCERIDLAPGEERRLDRALAPERDLCVRVWSRSETSLELQRLAGAKVSAVQADPERFGGVDLAAELSAPGVLTDAQGEATVATTDFVAWIVQVGAAGHLPSVVDVDFSPYLSSASPTAYDGCLNVVLEPAGAELRGIVVDASGRPIEGAIVFGEVPSLPREPVRLERGAPAVESRRPPFSRTTITGGFQVPMPLGDFLTVVVLPRRADLQHHFVRLLDPAERRSAVVVQLPPAWPLELELVDARGTLLEGAASVRDVLGRAHFPFGPLDDRELAPSSAGRVFPLDHGRMKMMHAGGDARIGFSPNGAWREGEQLVSIPAGPRERPLRVVVP